ncbi:MAG: hypothetical protein ABEJ99_01680 [Candidatus Nanohaloarchaea archaeon]
MSKGASQIVTMSMYIGITIAAISGAMTVGLPALQNQQQAASIQKAQHFMQVMDKNVQEVVSEGQGSTRTIRLSLDRGRLYYDNATNALIYELKTDAPVISPQSSRRTGNVILSSSAKVTVNETTVDGTPCYLMENEHVRACIRKVGSPDKREQINTSDLLVLYEFKGENGNKRLNANMTVKLNDISGTANGKGFTDPITTGNFIGTGKVKATIDTNPNPFTYDIIFSLPTGADFLKVDVQNFR